jgi:hypothetical protein
MGRQWWQIECKNNSDFAKVELFNTRGKIIKKANVLEDNSLSLQ